MINRIIVITTALARMELHNICFPLYQKFIGNTYDIKWFINIDKPAYCLDSQEATEQKLRNILSNRELFIYKSKKPKFLWAVRTLLKASEKYLTDDCCILWLEDDWMLNKDCSLKYFVDNFLLPNSFINLVHNMLGSFPPFVMGHNLAKQFYDAFFKFRPKDNPETFSRRIHRRIAESNGIIYYNYLDDPLPNKDLTKDNLVTIGLIYHETYLQIDDCRILTTNLPDVTTSTLPIEDLVTYRNQTTNKIIFVRFGTAYSNHNYMDSYFKDLGRQWKKNTAS